MSPVPTFAAVDLGASSGRVVIVPDRRPTRSSCEAHRFDAAGRRRRSLHWDVAGLLAEVRSGLRAAAAGTTGARRCHRLVGGRLRPARRDRAAPRPGARLPLTRDRRGDGATVASVGAERIYGTTGLQFLPFNTSYQLARRHRGSPDYRAADTLLMVPDLVNHALCGQHDERGDQRQHDAAARRPHPDVDRRPGRPLGLRATCCPTARPGPGLGVVTRRPRRSTVPVVAAASHDTASAVAGTPMSVTAGALHLLWHVVPGRLRAARPVTTPEAPAANVTNELGVDGHRRLLKNVTGLWLLEECRAGWRRRGEEHDRRPRRRAAADAAGRGRRRPRRPPVHRAGRHAGRDRARGAAASGQPVPTLPPAVTRVILDSLALAWRATIATIERVAGWRAEVVHLVGGGAADALLGDLCAERRRADRARRPRRGHRRRQRPGAGHRRGDRRRSRRRPGPRRPGPAAAPDRAPTDPRLGRARPNHPPSASAPAERRAEELRP